MSQGLLDNVQAAVRTPDMESETLTSSYPYLAACLALPADDDRSSCRLGNNGGSFAIQTDRVLGRSGAARRRYRRRRRVVERRVSAHRREASMYRAGVVEGIVGWGRRFRIVACTIEVVVDIKINRGREKDD
jgi:hypothetical protein